MRFSQRIGNRPVKTALQIGGIDEALTNRLWNCILEDILNRPGGYQLLDWDITIITKYIWTEFYSKRLDEIPTLNTGRIDTQGVVEHIDEWFFGVAEWDEIYDFIEFLVQISDKQSNNFVDKCNAALKKEASGYRIVDSLIVQITTDEEIESIEEALQAPELYKSVQIHLQKALDFLSDRKSPDYHNSIKESISAVEAICKIIVEDEKATLGKALATLERQNKLHPSLKEAYSKIYGYASDAGGIRHSMLEDGLPIEFEDAKFMLVSCSSFINYLKVKIKA